MRLLRVVGVIVFQIFLLWSVSYILLILGGLATQSEKIERIMKGVWSVSILVCFTFLFAGLGEVLLWGVHTCSLLPYTTIAHFSKASAHPTPSNIQRPIKTTGKAALWQC